MNNIHQNHIMKILFYNKIEENVFIYDKTICITNLNRYKEQLD